MSQIKTSHTTDQLFDQLVETIDHILKASNNQSTFNVGLSGGSIINCLTNVLPRLQTDLTKWRFYFCDERMVPIDNLESTYGTYLKQFTDLQIPIDSNQFIKINEHLPGPECALNYSNLIEENVPKNSDGVPVFDLLFLGMGPDGHTCSLFPNHSALNITDKLVTYVNDSPKPPPERVTFTYKLLFNAKNVLFIATGKSKQNIVREIFIEGKDYPASRIKGENVTWFLDSPGSAELLPLQFTT